MTKVLLTGEFPRCPLTPTRILTVMQVVQASSPVSETQCFYHERPLTWAPAHCLEQLLEQGHSVITTVRTEDKAQKIRDAYKDQAERLEVLVVPDIAREDAFNEVAKTPGLEAVLHTASPFHYKWSESPAFF